jgi:hypothetical protein
MLPHAVLSCKPSSTQIARVVFILEVFARVSVWKVHKYVLLYWLVTLFTFHHFISKYVEPVVRVKYVSSFKCFGANYASVDTVRFARVELVVVHKIVNIFVKYFSATFTKY